MGSGTVFCCPGLTAFGLARLVCLSQFTSPGITKLEKLSSGLTGALMLFLGLGNERKGGAIECHSNFFNDL